MRNRSYCLHLAFAGSSRLQLRETAGPASETAAGSSAPRIYVTNEVSGDLSVIDSGTLRSSLRFRWVNARVGCTPAPTKRLCTLP